MDRRAFFAGLGLAPVGMLGLARPEAKAVTIQLQGDTYSRQSVEDMIRSLNNAAADGYKIGGSRP